MKNLHVVMSAYSCGPDVGSEPGAGWHIALEMAKRHEICVITSTENRASIERELAANPVPTLRFVYLDWPTWLPWKRRARLSYEVQHYLWQFGAYRVARRLHRQRPFHLAHHVTLGRYWIPSFLALLPIPFLWGPVGGGESAPAAFVRDFGLKGIIYEGIRSCARRLAECDPFLKLTARRSALALGTTAESAARLRILGARTTRIVPQVGLSDSVIGRLGQAGISNGRPFTFISIGRLLEWKGFHLGLRAFARLHEPKAEYWIVGDGPDRSRLEGISQELGINDRVRFCGALRRNDVLALLEQCHVMVHPSLHESGGTVCVEAMAAGKPVICLDCGGPALLVTDEAGVKIPARTPSEAVELLSAAMNRLVTSKHLLDQLGAAGRRHASEAYSWTVRGGQINDLYTQLAHGGSIAQPNSVSVASTQGALDTRGNGSAQIAS